LTHIAKYGSEQCRKWFILFKKINHLSGEVKAFAALCILEEKRSFQLCVVKIQKVQSSITRFQEQEVRITGDCSLEICASCTLTNAVALLNCFEASFWLAAL